MSKTIVNRSHLNSGIKRIKEKLYGNTGIRRHLEEGDEIKHRKVLALVDYALDDENIPKKHQVEETLSTTVKEYLNIFDEVIPVVLSPQSLENEVEEILRECCESVKVSQKAKDTAALQLSFIRTMIKTPKAWASAVWIISLYFILKHYFPH